MSDGGFSVLRAELSQLTGSLLDLFRQRMEVVEEVAEHKRGTGKPVLDRRREEELLAGLAGHERVFLQTLLRLSRKRQYELLMADDDQWQLPQQLRLAGKETRIERAVFVPGPLVKGEDLLPGLHPTVVNSSLEAVQSVLAGNADTALIPVEDMVETYLLLDQAGLFINKAYGLGGRSRLLLVGTEFTLVEEASRLSLLLSISESKGVLAWVLSILADCGLTAARLECLAGSIFLELLARPEEEEILRVLYQLEKECGELRLLGWYSVESLA